MRTPVYTKPGLAYLLPVRTIRVMPSIFILLSAGTLAAAPPPAAAVPSGPSLTLAQAEQNALRHQPTVRQAAGQTEAAAGKVEEARAGYLPQVTATGTYYIVKSGGVGVTPTGTPVATGMAGGAASGVQTGLWSLGATGSQLIYDFNATADKWRSASANQDAAASNERTAVLQALLNVRRAYFTARGARDLAQVAEESVANQKKHLDQIAAMVQAGMKSQIDLVTQRAALATAEVQAVNAENTYAADLALLAQAMGLPGEDAFVLTDSEMPPVPGEDGDERQMIDAALKARPEVANAEQQRRAQDLLAASYKGSYFPALSAIGGVTEFGGGNNSSTPSWFVGLQASWALLQGGLTTGQIREANGTLTALTAQADGVRLQVSVDVVQGRLAVRAAKATIGGAEEALTNAREQLRLAEARYQTGQGSIIELADAQVAYTTAEAQEVSARYSLASARAQLLGALGSR
jgi:outer membrane protein